MLLLISFALLILGAVSQPPEQLPEHCFEPELRCKPDFVEDMLRLETMLPGTDFLEKNCEGVVSFTDCFVDRNNECPGEVMVNLEQVQALVHKICDKDSPLRKAYEENIDCVNGLQQDFAKLAERVDKLVRGFVMYLIKHGVDTDRQAILCAFAPIVTSEVADVVGKCGDDAKDAAVEILGANPFDCSDVGIAEYEVHLATYFITQMQDEIEEEVEEHGEHEEDKK